MDTLGQIGSIAALGSLILSRPMQLKRGLVVHNIRASRKHSQKPYRATENRRNYDAKFRIDGQTSPVEPQQNDILIVGTENWIVWRIIPSTAGSHWLVECMAPPSIGVMPLRFQRTPDGLGGFTKAWVPETAKWFQGKVREARLDRQITVESDAAIGRQSLSYISTDAPSDFDDTWRVEINGQGYEILSITTDDENPLWRNAVLARSNGTP